MKIVWGSVLDWLLYDKPIRYKTKFKYEHGLLPVNTVLDARFLLMEHEPKENLEEIFASIENYIKNMSLKGFWSSGYFTVRSPDNHSIVIVNPFVSTSYDNSRHLQVAKGLSGALFIGRHGTNINGFLLEMNKKLESLGMRKVDSIKLIEIIC